MAVPLRHVLHLAALVAGGMVATVLAPRLVPAQAPTAQAPTAPALAAWNSPEAAAPLPADRGLTWTRAIATQALVRGDTLRADDFTLRDTTVARLPFGADTTRPQAGWLVQRPIAAGEWLRAPAVIARPAVTAGRPVHAIWSDGTVRLAVVAVALNSAPIGGAVALRVGRTRRLDGIAVAPDTVRLR
jgi:flagella basal body P-ring formation protein FlgA